MFEPFFFGDSPASQTAYRTAIQQATDLLVSALPKTPYRGTNPADLAQQLAGVTCPPHGQSWGQISESLGEIIATSIAVWHPQTAAHLHTPVLIPALAAELILTALNPSMDSFDQAPSATVIELQVTEWLAQQVVGFGANSAGTFTAGGTQSNYMGLLLARDHFLKTRWNWDTLRQGLPPEARKLRFLCSEMAHFSVEKSAIQLGLGTDAVIRVPVDDGFHLRPDALREILTQLKADGLEPAVVVATASTTDFGSIDPIAQIEPIVHEFGAWLHVDAAYGGALLMSPTQKSKLAGIHLADSVTMDFHKAFFQPISCGAFLLADASRFDLIRVHAEYLNPESHEDAGVPDLVTRSILTTRRFDALKVWMSLQMVGAEGFAAMVDRISDLAVQLAAEISTRPRLKLLHQPEFGCVVFRYVPAKPEADSNQINYVIPRQLFNQGRAVLGHTQVHGQESLKFTLNNPCVALADLTALLDMIEQTGHELE